MLKLRADEMYNIFDSVLHLQLEFQSCLRSTIQNLSKESISYEISDYEKALTTVFHEEKIENISFIKMQEFLNNYINFLNNMKDTVEVDDKDGEKNEIK